MRNYYSLQRVTLLNSMLNLILGLLLLSLLGLASLAEATNNTVKQSIVIMPVQLNSGIESSLGESYQTAIGEVASKKYEIFTGSNVKSVWQQKSSPKRTGGEGISDAKKSIRAVVAHFNTRYVLFSRAAKISGGFTINFRINDVFADKAIYQGTRNCSECNQLDISGQFRKLLSDKLNIRGSAFVKTSSHQSTGKANQSASSVDFIEDESVNMAIADNSAGIVIRSQPSGAMVYWGEGLAGKTPYQNLDLQPNQMVELTLKLNEYRDKTVRFILKSGINKPKPIQLNPAFGSLLVTSEPDQAEVIIGGQKRGKTPLQLNRFPWGKYFMEIRKNLYHAERNILITVKDGQQTKYNAILFANFGTLSIATQQNQIRYQITQDKRKVLQGQLPKTIKLKPGKYQLRLYAKNYAGNYADNYADKKANITIVEGETLIINARQSKLRKKQGKLLVSTNPLLENARIFVNGKSTDEIAPATLTLPAGKHTIQIRHKAHSGSKKITIADRKKYKLIVPLKKGATKIQLKRRQVKAGKIGAEVPFNNDFVKLNSKGKPLSKSARQWACVADRTTGLIWEVKTNGGSIRDKGKKFRWGGRGVSNTAYSSTTNDSNRHKAKRWDGKGERYDDWNALLDAVNGTQLCGYSNWRVSTVYELDTLVQCKGGKYENLNGGCEGSHKKPTINTDYFPNTKDYAYWSSSPYAGVNYYAWLVNFSNGNDYSSSRDDSYHLRLVRSSQ